MFAMHIQKTRSHATARLKLLFMGLLLFARDIFFLNSIFTPAFPSITPTQPPLFLSQIRDFHRFLFFQFFVKILNFS